MADITLTSGMRTNLLQLQVTEKLMDRTQARISTGKKVNTALDGPAAFFAAKALTDRAGDLASLKESMGQAISTIKSADTAITAITSLVQQAKAVANTAKQNLGSDPAAIALRASSASQFDELMTQINTLVEDAGYAGKNLLLGDGSTFDATAASVTNVDSLTGVSGTSVSNIGGGTSASNISVAVTGTVDVTATSSGAVETALGIVADTLATTGFTSAGTMTETVATDGTDDHLSVTNSYSTGYTTYDDGIAATAKSVYLISEGSAATASTDLGLSSLQVTNLSVAEDVALSITSTGGTTTFAVTAPTGYNTYFAAQTTTDGGVEATRTFVFGDKLNTNVGLPFMEAAATDFAVDAIADSSGGSEVVGVSIARVDGGTSTSDYTMTVTYADGSTGTSNTQQIADAAGTATVTLTAAGTTVSFTGDDETDAVYASTAINLTTVTFDAAGVTAGSNAGTASLDYGTVTGNMVGTTGAGIAGSSTITMEDARDITITQGTTTFTRAVAPSTGEGTLSTGTNTFVLSSGVSVGMAVDLDTLAAGSSTLAAYTVTAASTTNDLEVFFNEDSTSSVSISSVKSNADGMSVANAANSWVDAADIDQAVTQLDAALGSLRTTGQTLTNSLSIVQTREDFTSNFINNLEEGANKWTLADANEEGANMLMLQTRQQLGTVTLSIASQSAQSIMRLFG